MVDIQIPVILFYGMEYQMGEIANKVAECNYPLSIPEAFGHYLGAIVQERCLDCALKITLETVVKAEIAKMN